MREWLEVFYQKVNGTTITINGKVYKLSDCEKIGGGSEKHVYKIKDEKLCFFIPNKWRSEKQWNIKIQYEKKILDAINDLGLKAQQFELVSAELRAPGKPTCAINVLLTKDFESLCKDESIIIHDRKGNKRVMGDVPDFIAMRERFKDKAFVQKMCKKIIREYAIAYTYSLPIDILQINDDSQHICFELSQHLDEGPVPRYMFWDVVSDTHTFPFFPLVPTLRELRKGPDKSWKNSDNDALSYLANTIACAIFEFSKVNDGMKFVPELEADFLAAIDDESFLNEALEHARFIAVQSIDNLLAQLQIEETKIDNEIFVGIMITAISTANLESLKKCYQLRPKNCVLSEEEVDDILRCANKYENQSVIKFLDVNLGSEKLKAVLERSRAKEQETHQHKIEELKMKFKTQYNAQLAADKGSWCGLYSFFAKSYVNEEMSLKDMVQHAQGLSKEGSGKRSHSVMRQMGWLDDNNQVGEEIKQFVM